ncbi:type II methionyl aminopeptidase [Candidatus Woesearchaeota archaeon]|nr:type II methionyl aminopeptidase [Candidatus Woesearchaeota archaeon]
MKDWIKAGEIASEVLEYGKGLIKKDKSVLEIIENVESKIFQLGGKPAFPAQISINEIAAHYAPVKEDFSIKESDIVKLDVGVHINGAIGDNAVTVGNNKELIEASREALNEAIKIIQIGTKLKDIGKVIDKTISSYGFNPVKNLTGHSIDLYEQHSGLSIPNYDNGDNFKLEKGIVIAIEPFATTGIGMIEEGKDSGIFKLERIKSVRTQISKEILDFIADEYRTLPFTKRWLLKKFPEFKVNFALRSLEKEGMISQYKQLPEKSKGIVSQAEHTLLIDDKVKILTKR